MKAKVIIIILTFSSFACTTTEILDFPEQMSLPVGWDPISGSRVPGSKCPLISGKYSEPPDIIQVDKKVQKSLQASTGSFYGHIPFHLADEVKYESNKLGLGVNQFLIQQTDATNFTMAFLTQRSTLVEYFFSADDGDFICYEGYIEFPDFSSYGMIEGKSMNFQIRNILFKDENGALIIKSTRGPYRKFTLNAKNTFTDEFYRYQQVR